MIQRITTTREIDELAGTYYHTIIIEAANIAYTQCLEAEAKEERRKEYDRLRMLLAEFEMPID